MPLLPVVTLKQKVIPPKGGKSSAIDLEERERERYIYIYINIRLLKSGCS